MATRADSSLSVVVAGTAAGFTGTVFGHPLDLIKVRLQARSEYKGAVDCLAKTFQNEGVHGMFRGMSPPLYGLTVLNAIVFGGYNKFNNIQQQHLASKHSGGSEPRQLTFYNHFLSGVGAGLVCGVFSCPFEVVKVRLQLDGKAPTLKTPNGATSAAIKNPLNPISNGLQSPLLAGNRSMHTSAVMIDRKYSGFFDCGRKVWRMEGFSGFFSGYAPTIMRDISFCATYFSIYEITKKHLQSHPLMKSEEGSFSPLPVILSGGLSGALAWVVAFPFDAVKTNMQDNDRSSVSKSNGKTNMYRVAKSHYQKVGISGFYSGLMPAVVRAFLVSSVRFFTFEAVLHAFKKHSPL